MPFVKNVAVNSTITWQQTSLQNDSHLIEEGNIVTYDVLTSGTGQGQINKAFYASSFLSSGEIRQFDLFNLNRTVFGQNVGVNFDGDNIKLFRVENKSTGIGYDLFVCATGSGGFTNMFGYSYLGWTVKPASYSIFFDANNGYLVNTGERFFYFNDISGLGVQYELGIFGVTFD